MEKLINSCFNQLDSRQSFHHVSSAEEKGLNRIYWSEVNRSPCRGHSFRWCETPLSRIHQTVSQITSQLGGASDALPKELNEKLIAIYEQMEIEENKILNAGLVGRITQTFWTVITAPFWLTLRPDWAVVGDIRQNILPSLQRRISLYFFKNLVQVDPVHSDLFLPLLKEDLNHINLICSVPLQHRVSVFEAFEAFRGKPIFGYEAFIVEGLETIVLEDRKDVAFHIASFWMEGEKLSLSYPILPLFHAIAEISPDRRALFCAILRSFIEENRKEFVSDENKIDYHSIHHLVKGVFFTEEMSSEDLREVFTRMFAIDIHYRSDLGELGYALKKKGFELKLILSILEYVSKELPDEAYMYRPPLYEAIAHCMNFDTYGKTIGDQVIALFRQTGLFQYHALSKCLIRILSSDLSSELRHNFFTALFNISTQDRALIVFRLAEKNDPLSNDMTLEDIRKLLESPSRRESGPSTRRPSPTYPDFESFFASLKNPGAQELELIQQKLGAIFQAKFSSKKGLYSCWRKWALKNHPDKKGDTIQVRELFAKVLNLKERYEELLKK